MAPERSTPIPTAYSAKTQEVEWVKQKKKSPQRRPREDSSTPGLVGANQQRETFFPNGAKSGRKGEEKVAKHKDWAFGNLGWKSSKNSVQ